MRSAALAGTDLPFPMLGRGKVRDVYTLPGERLLLVATDRLSAFDHVLPTPIPGRGRVLTRLSAFWFARTAHLVPNHFLSLDVEGLLGSRDPRLAPLRGRAMVVRRTQRVDVECVVRGYLAGSAWEEYRAGGTVGGLRLPSGLGPGSPLPRPLFTPAAKATAGHDENIPLARAEALLGVALARRLEEISLTLYRYAHDHAAACGLVLADTKFEFGLIPDGTLLLIDEALTPDSSRYWEAEAYRRGSLESFDKQFVRDYLVRIGWNREPPAPALPPKVVAATVERYRQVYRRLVGEALEEEGP
ncbi:MAG: phosphoribosylaminoimidazolesuccinocarboxamide synthase [Armatimonadota bacterium]|nr:phosphoribosylaminoimidazolesuccinocarboxamide synthase [Armatimonadota bacterium]MDR7427198.1 phosphoribosylaminoimidazolesuccinocarboxamide synthase [Armatimonadota bacterium]MDR7464819.1 phosphoribosylaminoimidazolesuccinocarboxamide synthase [Armatimonadota bacterium]MDR7470492.1 phosphoribosylaminoimidazolesuccinocarboxamide synthase [Armatimonadota bacterium]MDR7473905.1 phosphoribosylaminoimidazolesuccinocarboxamide synthase [Armatimonadota bacterium]